MHDLRIRPLIAFAVLALFGCGSQQLRLTAPDTAVGIGYTCTAANTCYPASVSTPEEGTHDDAIPLALPRECNGQFHEILIRNADSSSPEIDVTCAKAKPALGAAPAPSAAPAPIADTPAP
jgi:hypothetical protein